MDGLLEKIDEREEEFGNQNSEVKKKKSHGREYSFGDLGNIKSQIVLSPASPAVFMDSSASHKQRNYGSS